MDNRTERDLTEAYRGGRIGRRQFLQALSAVSAMTMAPAAALAKASPPPIQTVAMNHVKLLVSDTERSIAFYQRLFGMPIQARYPNTSCLRVGAGPQFLGIGRAFEGKPHISNFGISVKNFDADRTLATLKSTGLDNAKIEWRPRDEAGGGPGAPKGTPDILFQDPDGLYVQLSHVDYAGGAGLHGNVTTKLPAAPADAPLPVTMFNHCTILVDDIQRTVDFYQKHLGLFLQVKHTLVNAPDLGIGPEGPTPDHTCLGITHRPGIKPEINHLCLGLKNFDADRVLKILNDLGLKSGAGVTGPMTAQKTLLRSLKDGGPALGGPPGGTPGIHFYDPDGINIQIMDVSYCGEANAGPDGVCPN